LPIHTSSYSASHLSIHPSTHPPTHPSIHPFIYFFFGNGGDGTQGLHHVLYHLNHTTRPFVLYFFFLRCWGFTLSHFHSRHSTA
jgi:hypothetical protein